MQFKIGQSCVFRRTPSYGEQNGQLQRGKIIGLGVCSVIVGWLDSDKKPKAKVLNHTELTIVSENLGLWSRLQGCFFPTCMVLFGASFVVFMCVLTVVTVCYFSITQVLYSACFT
jgi:hypothetical protein